jgi:hypothetical protein
MSLLGGGFIVGVKLDALPICDEDRSRSVPER